MFDWLTHFVTEGGYVGIAALMFLENIFPPIPSELIMPLAGFSAARGELNIILVILSGSIGALCGAVPWYLLGRLFGKRRVKGLARRLGRWFVMSEDDVEKACTWFHRYGAAMVFFGRFIPAVRTLISVPAGITRLNFWTFLGFSALGTVLWTSFLALAGYVLETQYERVAVWLDPGTKIVVAFFVILYLYRVITYKTPPEHTKEEDEGN